MLSWCKLHTDVLGDAKLQSAARKGAKHLVVLPWLFAWARAHDDTDTGRLVLNGAPAEPEDVAAQLPGVTAAQVRACLTGLEQIGVLVRDADDVLRFAAWEGRSGQASSRPSDSRESVRDRVRRHRETKRATEPNAAGNAGEVTTGNDGNALRNALDREEEKEGEKERDQDPPPATRAPAADDAVRPRLPDAYRPDLDALLTRVPPDQRAAWLRSMAARLDGLHPPAVSPQVLGEALRAFSANGAELKLALFEGYVRRAGVPPKAPPAPPLPRLSPGDATRAAARHAAGSLTGLATAAPTRRTG